MTGLVADKALDNALELIIGRLQQKSDDSPPAPRTGSTAALARALYRERQIRTKFLGTAVHLGEPGWDILLDLYIAASEQRRVSVSSLCIASGVPSTTALRWIALLVERGALVRESDDHDRRRAYLRLSDATKAAMDAYLSAVRGA